MSTKHADLSVGELAQRAGVAVSALHFYEQKGLIRSWRNSSNHRRYSRSTLRRVSIIKAAQRSGMSLQDISQAFSTLPDDEKISHEDWQQLSSSWKQEIDERIERLTLLRDTLSYCIGCGCLSEKYCEMINPGDRLQKRGAGPHFLEPGEAQQVKQEILSEIDFSDWDDEN